MVSTDVQVALEVLEGLYRECAAGSGRLALVTGGPSIGKTSLLQEFSHSAAKSGALVLTSVGSRTERQVQYGVAHQLFSNADLSPELRAQATETIDLRTERWDAPQDVDDLQPAEIDSARALSDSLLHVARRQPVVVCVDDVQFADRASLQLQLHLQRRLTTARILIVLTYWEWPQLTLPLFHAEITRLPHHRLRLRPLSPEAVTTLVAERLGEQTAERAGSDFYRRCGGNPGLTNALIEDYRSGAHTAFPDDDALPTTDQAYRQAVLTCLHRWDPLLLRAAQGLAVLEHYSAPNDLADLLQLTPDIAGHAISVLGSAGLLEEGQFRTQAGRKAVLSSLSPEARRALHLRAAELLWHRGSSSIGVADHLVAADEVTYPWSIAVLREASEEALAADDPTSAACYLELALSAELTECERMAVIEALACAKWRIDPSATMLYTRQLSTALEDGILSYRGTDLLFRNALLRGDSSALPQTLVALKNSDDRSDRQLDVRAALACHWVFGRREEGHPARGMNDVSFWQWPMASTDDPWADAANAVASSNVWGNRETTVLGAERILQNYKLSDATLPALVAALYAMAGVHETEKAARWCDTLIAEAARRRATTWWAQLEGTRAHVALTSGALATAAAHAEEALSLVSSSGWGVSIGGPLACLVQANTAMERLDAAAAALEQRVPENMFDTMFGVEYLRARGRYHLATNGLLAAISDFQNGQDLLVAWGQEDSTIMRLLSADRAQASLMLGRTAAARELVNEQLRSVGQIDSRVRALSLRILAHCGPPTQRPATLKQAVRCAQASGDRYELARTLGDLGRAYQELGESEQAREVGLRAVQETQACLTISTLTEQPLQGPAVGSPDSRAQPPSTPILSEAEHRVAVLAAQGHTNRAIGRRLYITVSTVEQHLTRVYKKLGVNGRTGLTAHPL